MINPIKNIISEVRGVFGQVTGLVDNLNFSGEEKAEVKQKLQQIQQQHEERLLEHTEQITSHQKDVIVAEAKSESWLARNWRPILMLDFGLLLTAHWFGFTPENLDPNLQAKLMEIIKFSLGGYITFRSGEKVTPHVKDWLKERERRKREEAKQKSYQGGSSIETEELQGLDPGKIRAPKTW